LLVRPTYRLQICHCVQLNALFCCLWRTVEVSCHKHFVVFSSNQHRLLLPAMCHNLRHAGRAPPATALTTPAVAALTQRLYIASRGKNFKSLKLLFFASPYLYRISFLSHFVNLLRIHRISLMAVHVHHHHFYPPQLLFFTLGSKPTFFTSLCLFPP